VLGRFLDFAWLLQGFDGHRVREAIEVRGAALFCLAPLKLRPEPDRQLLSKLKALLRKAATRSIDSVWEIIGSCPPIFRRVNTPHTSPLPDTVAGNYRKMLQAFASGHSLDPSANAASRTRREIKARHLQGGHPSAR
jgi:hypothetical protein